MKIGNSKNSKKIITIVVMVLVVFAATYAVLFASSPIKRPVSVNTSPQTIKTIGTVTKRKIIANQNSSISMIPKECAENPYELEKTKLSLTGNQLTELINLYKSSDVPVNNIQVWFSEGRVYGAGSSAFLLLPGEVRVIADIENYWFKIKDVVVGQLTMNESVREEVDRQVQDIFYRYLASTFTTISITSIQADSLELEVLAPDGMISVEEGTITVNNNIMNDAQNFYANCTGTPQDNGGDLQIQIQ